MANQFFQTQVNFSKLAKYVEENKDKLYTNKDGESFVSLNVWINEQPDQFGNLGSVQINTPKDQKKIYIGNFKDKKDKIPF